MRLFIAFIYSEIHEMFNLESDLKDNFAFSSLFHRLLFHFFLLFHGFEAPKINQELVRIISRHQPISEENSKHSIVIGYNQPTRTNGPREKIVYTVTFMFSLIIMTANMATQSAIQAIQRVISINLLIFWIQKTVILNFSWQNNLRSQ